ncbi:hypothetical protein ABFX02_08G188500 [Erythranthe guttata]
MDEQALTESNREIVHAVTPKKINRIPLRKLSEFEERGGGKFSPEAKKIRRALQSVNAPSYCLKEGVGSLKCVDETLRHQHRNRLTWLLDELIRQHNWAEACGVLSVLLQGTARDKSLTRNRAKYSVALELLNNIKGETMSPKDIQDVYDLWIAKFGSLRNWSTKDRFAVRLEIILTFLQNGILDEARKAAHTLKQVRDVDSDPVANLVFGLGFCQQWYSGLREEFRLTELDLSGTNMPSVVPADGIHQPVDYSNENDANSTVRCDSSTSVANDKVFEDDSNRQIALMEIDSITKNETSPTSSRPPEVEMELAEPGRNSNCYSPAYCGDLPRLSIFYAQGLPTWLFPMKLPASHERLEDEMKEHRRLLNDDHKNALQHLRVAINSIPPVVEAIHPLIQMLLLGDHVHEAFDEVEALLDTDIPDRLLTLRLKAGLLEHFDSGNYIKLCLCYEEILKKDPTCSDALAKLVLMHQLGEYDTQDMVEMVALHLDASYATCDTWQELASCFLKLSQCEGDRESNCGDADQYSQGYLDHANKIPELLVNGESGKAWKLRSRWWLNRHFHKSILMADAASGDLKLLTYKAAAASHIYGRHFDYVVKATECIEQKNDMELYSLLQTHILNSVGFCSVKRNIC